MATLAKVPAPKGRHVLVRDGSLGQDDQKEERALKGRHDP